MKTKGVGIIISALPGAFMVGLFYSLAIHMRYSLGAWPTSIGTNGFSRALVRHGDLAWKTCGALLWTSLFILPVLALVCAIIPRSRKIALYLLSCSLFVILGWGLMLLAPRPFLYWWWD